MEPSLAGSWSSYVARGIAALAFGVALAVWPGLSLLTLTFLFSAYAFCDGAMTITVAKRHEQSRHRWLILLEGIVGLSIGVFAAVWPAMTPALLVYLAAARALLVGGLQVAASTRVGLRTAPMMISVAGGVITALLGVAMLTFPTMTTTGLIALLVTNAFAFGPLSIVLGLRLRSELDIEQGAAAR